MSGWNRGMTGMALKKPRRCPTCKQMMSKELLELREKKRAKNISLAKQEALKNGEPCGRPRTIDYREVIHLREQGFSISQIMKKLNCGRGAVQHALRTALL